MANIAKKESTELQQYSVTNASSMMNLANELANFIKEKKLTQAIQGKEYVLVEAWTFAGMNMGLAPVMTALEKESGKGEEIKYRATVELMNLHTGAIVGRAFAICSNLEPTKKYFQEYAIASMAQCVPVRAKILTKEGFKFYHQLTLGESVLAYDCETDHNYWTPLEDVNIFPPTEVLKLENRSFLAYCTPEHTWAIESKSLDRQTTYRKLKKTQDLKGGNIILAAESQSGGSDITDEEAYLLGWILTDGCIRYEKGHPRIHIDQSKVKYIVKIRQAVYSLAKESVTAGYERTFPTGRTYQCKKSHRFAFGRHASRELLERYAIISKDDPAILGLVCRLSSSARKAMLEAMLQADGSMKRETAWQFGKKKPIVMEAFQILATLEGKALGKLTHYDDFPRQMMRSHKVAQVSSLSIEKYSKEPVWCPTTKYGTWVMQIDGNVMITGNTRAVGKVYRLPLGWLMKAAGYESTPAEELADAIVVEEERKSAKPTKVAPEPAKSSLPEGLLDAIEGAVTREELLEIVDGNKHLQTNMEFTGAIKRATDKLPEIHPLQNPNGVPMELKKNILLKLNNQVFTQQEKEKVQAKLREYDKVIEPGKAKAWAEKTLSYLEQQLKERTKVPA